jgi:hypothetical protein
LRGDGTGAACERIAKRHIEAARSRIAAESLGEYWERRALHVTGNSAKFAGLFDRQTWKAVLPLPPAPAMLADGDPQAALGVELLRLRDMLREGLRDMDITDLEAAWRRLASAARPAGS